jgi:hypothetical protein
MAEGAEFGMSVGGAIQRTRPPAGKVAVGVELCTCELV